jgi:hypothetical protein
VSRGAGALLRLATWVALAAVAIPATAVAQGADERQRLLQVRHADGSVKPLRIQWRPNFRVERSETGGAANVTRFKLTDDRQCSWTIEGEILREVFGLEGGQMTARAELARAIPVEGATVRREYRGEDCGESLRRLEADASAVRSKVAAAFAEGTRRDLEAFVQDLRRDGQVATVEAPVDRPDDKDRKEIQTVLEKYKAALESSSEELFRSVYPDLPAAQFARVQDSFRRTEKRTVELRVENITVFGSTAEAKGRRRDVYRTKDGQEFKHEGAFVFKLGRRTDRGWVIVAAY